MNTPKTDMNYLIINDLHLAVQRVGGTTPASAQALREYCHAQYQRLINMAKDGDTVIVNGDLTDVYDTPLADALELYAATANWLDANPNNRLVWSQGNHDLSRDSRKMGTVGFVGRLLQSRCPDRFTLVEKPTLLDNKVYIIPHVVNQALFDLELSRIPLSAEYVLLHCNTDNPFAAEAEHSLNLSVEQARTLVGNGHTLVLGHEHQGRTLLGGKLIIVGNQFPSSISDCLSHGGAQRDGSKYLLRITPEEPLLVQTWNPNVSQGWFQDVNWRDLDKVQDGQGFLRVSGSAQADESATVVKAIAALRTRSEAFVITNAVRVATTDTGDVEESLESFKSVNVMDWLLETLDPAEQVVVRQMMKD